MGFTHIPEKLHQGRNQAVIQLDQSELSQTVHLLQSVLSHLSKNPRSNVRFSGSSRSFKVPPYNSLFQVSRPASAPDSFSGNAALKSGTGIGSKIVSSFASLPQVGSTNLPPSFNPHNFGKGPATIGRPSSPPRPVSEPISGQGTGGQPSLRSSDRTPGSGERNEPLEEHVGRLAVGTKAEQTGIWWDEIDMPTGSAQIEEAEKLFKNGHGTVINEKFPTKLTSREYHAASVFDGVENLGYVGLGMAGATGPWNSTHGRIDITATARQVGSEKLGKVTVGQEKNDKQLGKDVGSEKNSSGGMPTSSKKFGPGLAEGDSKKGMFSPNSQTQSGIVRVPDQASLWRGNWSSAVAEHNREYITGMAYIPVLEGLVGGEMHSGWLVSSSRKLLNLWECTSEIQHSEPIQIMHSQTTECVIKTMDVDPAAKVLLGFCTYPLDQGCCISVHSLSGETFFGYKGMIRVPDVVDEGKLLPRGLATGGSRVVSLQPLGGPLRTSLAAAVCGEVLVYELSAVESTPSAALAPKAPKAQWKAHSSSISCMHRSSFVCALFTGATDGSIHLWDLKTKPSAPVRQYSHTKQVTQISMLNSNTVVSCAADGTVSLWDIRSSGGAFLSICPDKTPVIDLVACFSGSAIGLTTVKGLYCWEPSDQPGPISFLSPLVTFPSTSPCTNMKWNEKAKHLYVSGADGAITVFARV